MPLHFPNRYTFSMLEKRARSNSSAKQALYVISRIYLWGELRKIKVHQILYYGEFIRSDDAADLIDFIQFTSITQKQLVAQSKNSINFHQRRSVAVLQQLRFNCNWSYQYRQIGQYIMLTLVLLLVLLQQIINCFIGEKS